ncbi:wall-associated receptor kinase 2-like protein [Tanacetum coccineum]
MGVCARALGRGRRVGVDPSRPRLHHSVLSGVALQTRKWKANAQFGPADGKPGRTTREKEPDHQVPAGDGDKAEADGHSWGKMMSETQGETLQKESTRFYRSAHRYTVVLFQDPERSPGCIYTATVDRSKGCRFHDELMRERQTGSFADAFARYDSGGASGSGGSRARDGDDTGGEDGGDDTNINECEDSRTYPCYGDCINTQGSYNCTCFRGTTGDAKTQNGCQPVAAKDARWKILIIGMVALSCV